MSGSRGGEGSCGGVATIGEDMHWRNRIYNLRVLRILGDICRVLSMDSVETTSNWTMLKLLLMHLYMYVKDVCMGDREYDILYVV